MRSVWRASRSAWGVTLYLFCQLFQIQYSPAPRNYCFSEELAKNEDLNMFQAEDKKRSVTLEQLICFNL